MLGQNALSRSSTSNSAAPTRPRPPTVQAKPEHVTDEAQLIIPKRLPPALEPNAEQSDITLLPEDANVRNVIRVVQASIKQHWQAVWFHGATSKKDTTKKLLNMVSLIRSFDSV